MTTMSESKYLAQVEDDEELEFDKSAYILYHQAETGYPCLSFQIIPDHLGSGEERLNQNVHTLYMIAGTQSPKAHQNNLILVKMNNLTAFKRKVRSKEYGDANDENKAKDEKMEQDEEEGDDESEEKSSLSSEDKDDEESDTKDQPVMEWIQVHHNGCVNRIRLTTISDRLISASWSDLGKLNYFDH